jgi:hypothetical protein
VYSGTLAQDSAAYPEAMPDDPLAECTTDIDAEVAAAIYEAWSAEGLDFATAGRRRNRGKSKAARDRFLRSNPGLVRALASRYQAVDEGDALSDTAYLGLWIYKHPEQLRAAWHSERSSDSHG